MSVKNRIRLFVEQPLENDTDVICTDAQRHYLVNVMRRQIGDEVCLFNGRDGEYACEITEIDKKICHLRVKTKIQAYYPSPDIWLLFAPLKKDRTDYAVSKAVELGVSKIIPVQTEWTENSVVRTDRLRAQAVESSEQSRRQDVPVIEERISLDKLLATWPTDRCLIFMDESGLSESVCTVMPKCLPPAGILVGPEAGFSQKELEKLRSLSYTYGISLGTRILRAETAVVAALSCWQAFCGDWDNNKGVGNENSDRR